MHLRLWRVLPAYGVRLGDCGHVSCRWVVGVAGSCRDGFTYPAGFIDSLRESRDLARSGRDLSWFQRPLWRGAFISSIWFAVVLAITLGAQWGTLHQYLNQLMTTQDPQALLQQMTEAQKASGFNIAAFALSVVEKVLQPLVGIAFVVLYLDSKLELPSHVEPIVRAGEGDALR